MSRKSWLNYPILVAADLSADFDTFQDPTNIDFLDNASIQLEWSGALPVGTFEIYVSNDKADPSAGRYPTNWTMLNFGSTIIINSSQTSHIINMNQLSFSWLAVKYNFTSGTGTMDANLTGKAVGS